MRHLVLNVDRDWYTGQLQVNLEAVDGERDKGVRLYGPKNPDDPDHLIHQELTHDDAKQIRDLIDLVYPGLT